MTMHDHKQCFTPGPPAKEYTCEGNEENWDGLDIYVNWPTGATQAIVLASDVFGWKRPLLRKLADNIAAEGFVTVVPDFFKGNPLTPDPYPTMEEGMKWLASHPFVTAVADTLASIKVLKNKGIQAIALAGFCYGGKVGAIIANAGVTDAIVVLHPSMVTIDDITSVKTPFAILAAEFDEHCSLEQLEEWREFLASQNEVEYLVKIFPGVHHGWTVRYDENDENLTNQPMNHMQIRLAGVRNILNESAYLMMF